MIRIRHKATQNMKRFISMILATAIVSTIMPAIPIAHAAGGETGTIVNNAEVSYDRAYTKAYAEFNALNKKATPVNLVLLVDKGITGSSSYPKIKSIIEDNLTNADSVTAGKFAFNAGSRVEIIQYTANVTTSAQTISSDSEPLTWNVNTFKPTYGTGNSDEIAALEQAITAVQTAKKQNNNPTAVLWVLGDKFNRDRADIEDKIQALTSELDDEDAFMTWQYADAPAELLKKYASKAPDESVSAYASTTDFRNGLLDTLKKITSDSLGADLSLTYSKGYEVGNYIVDAQGSAFVTALLNDDATQHTTTASIALEAGAPSCKDHTFKIGVNLEDNFNLQSLLPEQGPYTVTWNTGFWDLETQTQTYKLNSVNAQIPSFTLTYDIDESQKDEFGIDEISKQYRQNTKIYLPKPANIDSMYQEGKAFSGWVDQATNASYSPGDFFDVNKDTTLVPAWGKIVVEKYIGVIQDVGDYSNVIAEDVRERLENTTVSGFLNKTTSITFEDTMPSFVRLPEENNQYAVKITDSEYEDVVYATNIGENGSVVILAFKLADGSTSGNEKYEAFIYAEGGAVASSGFNDMFYNQYYTTSNDYRDLYPILETIKFNGKIDTSNVTDMSGLFKNLTTLESVDVENLDTTNVTNMSDMFRNVGIYAGTAPIDGSRFLNEFVTSTVTNISGMFASDDEDYYEEEEGVNIINIDLSSWDTSNVTDMSLLFKNYEYTVDGLEGLDVSKVNNFSEMFFGTLDITDQDTLDLSNWNIFGKTELISDKSVNSTGTGDHHGYNFKCNVTLGEMFQEAIIDYDIKLATSEQFNNEDVIYVHVDEMFKDATFSNAATFDLPWAKIKPSYYEVGMWEYPGSGEDTQYSLLAFAQGAKNIDQASAQKMITNINVEGVKWLDLCSIFEECTGITSIDMSHWNLTCADMGYSFGTNNTSWRDTLLTSVDLPKAERFGFINNLFTNRKGLRTITYPQEATAGRGISSNGSYVFYGCSALTTELDFSKWDWSGLQSMDYMFTDASSVKTIVLPPEDKLADDGWVIEMFSGCTSLEGKIDLSGLKNARTYISGSDEYDDGVFEGCKNLEEVDLSGWELSTVSLWNMFKGCTNLKKVDLSGWKKLYNLKHMQNAFSGCESLTEVNFGDAWDSTIEGEYNKDINATSMAYMFYNCKSLTSINMTGFSVKDVSNFDSMFSGCTSLKSITLDKWATNFGQSFNTDKMFSGVKNATLTTNVPQFRDAWSTDNGEFIYTEATETTEPILEGLEEDVLGDPVSEEQPSNGDVSNTEPPAGDQGESVTEPTEPPVTDEEEQPTVTPPATTNPDAPEDTPPTSTDSDKTEGEPEGTPPAVTEPDKTEDSSENQGETDGSSTSTEPTEPEDDAVEPEEAPEQTTQDVQDGTQPEVTPDSNPVSAFSANIRNAGAVSDRQDRLPVYGMTIQNMSDLTRSAVLYGVTPDTLLAPQARMLLGGSEGLYTNPDATEVGTKVDYIVLVRYEGDAGGLSGKVEFTDKLPEGLAFVKNDDGSFKYDVGAVEEYDKAIYQDTAKVDITIDESTRTLTGTCDNLLAGNYIAITFTCEITGTGETIEVGDEQKEYWIWDNTAAATDDKTSDSSATIRLWYTFPDGETDPEEPDLNEHAVTYVYRGEIPEGITVPVTAWYQEGETVTVPEIGTYEGYTHAANWVTDSEDDALKTVSAVSGTTFTMPDEDIVLTLDWTKNKSDKTVTIQYVYEGEAPNTAPVPPESMTFSVGELVNIFVADTQIEGYTLSYDFDSIKNWQFEVGNKAVTIVSKTGGSYGYNVGSTFHELTVTDGKFDTASLLAAFESSETTATLTLKCKYTPLTGRIEFDDNTTGYTGYMSPMRDLTIKNIGDSLTKNQFQREGYTFAGWSLTPGENQTIVRTDEAPIGNILKLGETVTLYAQWVFTASSLQLAPLTVYGENAAMDYKLADQKYIYSDGGEESIIPSSTKVTLVDSRGHQSDVSKSLKEFLNPYIYKNGSKYLHIYNTFYNDYNYMLNEFGHEEVTYRYFFPSGGAYNKDNIYINDKKVELLDSSLRVRYVNTLTSMFSTSISVYTREDTSSNKSSIEQNRSFGAILPKDTELYVNDYTDWSTSNTGYNIRLLKDALLSNDQADWGAGGANNETVSSFISAAEAESVTIDPDKNQFFYLDLIDTNLGNAWITSTEGVKVYWPYPTTIGESNKDTVQLIRFTGLNREYGMEGERTLEEQLANCTVETIEIDEHTKNGFWFTFDGDGAAIYAITWGDIPDVTVNFDDQIPGGDDGYYETITLDRVVDETNLSKTRKLVDTEEYQTVTTPVYKDHIFKGWFTKPNGQGNSVDSIYIGLDTPVESVITLYAYWIPDVNFTVHFEPNNGDKIESQSVKMSAYLQWVNDGENANTFPFTAVTGNWTNDDKFLAGWTLDVLQLDISEELKNKIIEDESRYISVTTDKDVSVDAIKEAMDFVLYLQDDYGVNLSEITIYAMWLEDTTYTIHFDTHCGVEIPSQSVKFSEILFDGNEIAGLKDGKKYKEVSAPEIEGYTAEYWYLDIVEVYGELLDILYDLPEEDRVPGEATDEGSWNYWIAYIERLLETYESNPQYSKQKVSYDESLNNEELITVLSTMYQLELLLGIDYRDITVHLSWGDNVQMYNLTYHSNDGTDRTYNRTLLSGSTVTVEGGDLFTRDGYVLTGWNTQADGNGTAYAFGSKFTMPAGQDATLYAVWKESKYTLTYDSNDGTGRTDKVELLENGATVTVKDGSLFPRSGYKLTGWNTKADGSGTAYAFGSEFTMPENQDATLYAVWAKTYTVSYDLQGGIGADGVNYDPQTYPEGTTITVLAAPHRDGYTFVGWSTVNGSGISYQPSDTFRLMQDTTLFAQWKKNSDGGAHHPEVTPDDDDDEPEEKPEEIIEEDVPLAETPWLNTDDHYAYIIGYAEDGTVRPQANITRAEVATIFFRLLTDEARDQFWMTTNNFPDVAPDAWYNNAISTMVNAGIIQGYEDGTFRPNNNITRAEFAAIASRFMSSGYDVEEDLFTDIANHWARDNINDAAMTQWIHGYPDGTFLPDKAITRAEAVTLVNNVLQRKPDADRMLDDMIVWPDNPEGAWYYEAIQEATNSHDYDMGKDYETWTALLENRDWAALEKDWLNAHRTGGEVM